MENQITDLIPPAQIIIQNINFIQLFIVTYLSLNGFIASYKALNKAIPQLDPTDLNFTKKLFEIKVENLAVTSLIINGFQLIISIFAIYLLFFSEPNQITTIIENIPFIGKRIKEKTKKLA